MNNTYTIDEDKIFAKFTDNAKKIIVSSYDIARRDPNNYSYEVTPKHLFVSLLVDKKNMAARLLEKLNVDLAKTADAILEGGIGNYASSSFIPTEEYKKILAESFVEAAQLSHVYVGSEHILLAMLRLIDLPFINDLVKSGLNYGKIREELLSFGSYQPGVFVKSENTKDLEGSAPGNNALEYFGRNMVKLAKEGKYLPILGREKEIARLINILSRQTKNNPILVGEAGVGKTAIIEGLAQRIVSGDVPASFKDVQIIQLDTAAIIAGAKIRGDVEERLLAIIQEVQRSSKNILFIDEIHSIVGGGNVSGGSDIANIIKPYLTNNNLRVVGATTLDEYRKYFEEDSALARRFQPITVQELDVNSSIGVLKFLQNNFETFHKVTISPESIIEAVKLSERYITDRYLPDKAIDLIDEAAAKKKITREKKDNSANILNQDVEQTRQMKDKALQDHNLDLASDLRLQEIILEEELDSVKKKSEQKSKKFKVEVEDIREIVSDWTKIPVSALTASDIKSISGIQTILSEKIIGQDSAITKIGAALKRAKLGIANQLRPLGSFLFLGPTGVGKTESAKVIARELFGSEDALVQVNMSEFMEQHSVSKIIGAPPGYIGYQDGNHLSEKIRRRPYSVVLFDEIEKAHPDVLNILLQVLEEGYLQDSRGRKVNFKNTIIILTSNIGANEIADDKLLGFAVNFSKAEQKEVDDAYEDMRNQVLVELKNYLRPEFINRLDEIIVYRGLSMVDALKIAKLQIEELKLRLQEKHLLLSVDLKLIKRIAEEGFSKEYGARNIRRKIQETLENSIADYLLDSKLLPKLQRRQKQKLGLLDIEAKSDKNGVISFTV